ncbi:MAG: helix-turn-helix domain-containing protein [Patescibacteria group bacterium]
MKPNKLLALFNLKPIEAELFSQLFTSGLMSASQLAKQAGISRTSVYDLLKHLIEVGLVSETLKGGTKAFVAAIPEKIQLLVEEKQKEISAAGLELESLKKQYQNQSKSLTPKLQLYTGQKELQQMMKDILLYRNIEVMAYWPIKKMIELLGAEFIKDFHQKRQQQNISLKVIWPKAQVPDLKKYPFLLAAQNLKREVRIAPAGVDFTLGYSIYGNTVRFISSSKESFGFLVESQELAEMMKSQFQIIWQAAKSFRQQPRIL